MWAEARCVGWSVKAVGDSATRRCGASLSSEARGVKAMNELLPQPGGFGGGLTDEIEVL